MRYINTLALFMLITVGAWSQEGTLDPSFGVGGIVLKGATELGNINSESAKKCFIQSDGKILVLVDMGGKAVICRRMSNGDRDVTFGHNGFSDLVVVDNSTAAMQSDGKIIIVGGAQNSSDFLIARFNPDGTLDANFGYKGVTVTDAGTDGDFLNAIAIAPDGKIYAGGLIADNTSHFALIRYTATGQPDPSFGQNGIVITNIDDFSCFILALTVLPDGKVLALGQVAGNDGGDYALAKYDAGGNPDLTFNGTGRVVTSFAGFDYPAALAVAGDGKIYTGGTDDAAGFQHFRIVRYNSDGSADLTYNNGSGSNLISFGDSYDMLSGILLQNDGKLLAAGQITLSTATNSDIELVRLNSDGTLDTDFGIGGLVTFDTDSNYDSDFILATDNDGKIITGGGNQGARIDYTMFRCNAEGIPDPSFGQGGTLVDYIPGGVLYYGAVFKQSDGKLLVSSSSFDGTNSKNFLSRFNENGSPDNSYGQSGSILLSASLSLFQPDGKSLAVSSSASADGGDFSLSRINPDGTPDLGFGTGGTVISDFGGNEIAYRPALQPDGKIIVVGLQYGDFGSHLLIARYNSNGTLDNSFGTNGLVDLAVETECNIQSMAVQPDGKILLGGNVYSYPPDFSYFRFDEVLIRVNPNGSLDNTFGQSGIIIKDRGEGDFVGTVVLQADNKIVYTYGVSHGLYKYYAERLNPDGSTDNSFGQNGQVASVGAGLVIQSDQKIILSGWAPNLSSQLQSEITRLNTDGTMDNSFGTNGKIAQSFAAGDNIVSPSIIVDNSLFVTGRATTISDSAVIAKIRLSPSNGISCPAAKVVSTDYNTCSARVTGIDPSFPTTTTIKYKLTGATKGSGNGTVSGKVFNRGITTVTYTLKNDVTKTCSFTVTVQDKELPVIENVTVSNTVLWPADHKMKDITVNYSAHDNCGIANIKLLVSSNEIVQSNENGDQSPDWQVLDAHHIRLRAERLQSKNGRTYTITIIATDLSGNQSSKMITVTVPKTIVVCNLNITAHPNPSRSYFNISITSSCADKINIRIMDNRGNVLSVINNLTAPRVLNVGDRLLPGIYYLEATQGTVTKSIKLIKQ